MSPQASHSLYNPASRLGSAPKTVVMLVLRSRIEPHETMAIDLDSIGGEVHTQCRSPL